MRRDLALGLDDPYDERAAISCEDMAKWEEEWQKGLDSSVSSDAGGEPLSLLIFIRTGSSNSLLKSKSAMRKKDLRALQCNPVLPSSSCALTYS